MLANTARRLDLSQLVVEEDREGLVVLSVASESRCYNVHLLEIV